MAERGSPSKYESPESAEAYRGKFERSLFRRLSSRREIGLVRRALAELGELRSVLDCPCGAGRLLPLLSNTGARVFGADASAAMIREARAAGLCQAAAQDLPFADGSFDAVVCHRLLHHFAESEVRRSVLREAARVARKGVVVSFADADTWKGRRVRSRRRPITADQLAAEASAAGLILQRPVRRICGLVSVQAVALLRP